MFIGFLLRLICCPLPSARDRNERASDQTRGILPQRHQRSCPILQGHFCTYLVTLAHIDNSWWWHILYRHVIKGTSRSLISAKRGTTVPITTSLIIRSSGTYRQDRLAWCIVFCPHSWCGRYPVADHNVPSLGLMLAFCEYVQQWMRSHEENMIAVHCRGGKGRSGTMICAWLLYSGICATAEDALDLFGSKRTDWCALPITSPRSYA